MCQLCGQTVRNVTVHTYNWTNGRAKKGGDGEDAHGETTVVGLEHVGNDTTRVGHGTASKGACKETENEHRVNVLGATDTSVEGREGNIGEDEHGTATKDFTHRCPEDRTNNKTENVDAGD